MRVGFVGVSHWHIPLYLDPVLALPGATVVGVSDPSIAAARAVAERAGCPAFDDHRELCERARPEFVFGLGRHCDMAELGRFLIARGVPFALEKPCGISSAEVDDLAARAAQAGAFAAVPFVFRRSRMMETIREIAPGERTLYLAFKFVAGSTRRYRDTGCTWMLSRATAGGGAMLNLGVHFLDLAIQLLGPETQVAGATFSNALDGDDVEDHGVVLLRAGAAACVVETGYVYPAPHMSFDMHFSIRTERHHFAVRDADGLEIVDADQRREFRPMPTTNPPYYPPFVQDVLARAAHRDRPVAGLDDMAAAMRLLEAAYAAAPALVARRPA